MNDFGFVREDMAAASAAADDAVALARGADGSEALRTLAESLPGTQTAAYLPTLADLWADGIQGWCDTAEDFARAISDTERDGSGTDVGVAGWFGFPTGGG